MIKKLSLESNEKLEFKKNTTISINISKKDTD